MSTTPEDLDDIVRAALEEEAALPPVTEADVDAALADPVLAGILARVLQAHEGKLTAKGLERMRRSTAIVFLRDPESAALLARVREGALRDGSGAVVPGEATVERPIGASPPAPRRRRGTTP
jgi:hypothetical protein